MNRHQGDVSIEEEDQRHLSQILGAVFIGAQVRGRAKIHKVRRNGHNGDFMADMEDKLKGLHLIYFQQSDGEMDGPLHNLGKPCGV